MASKTPLTYKDAGVDLDLYRDAMARLPQLVRKTHSPRVIDLPGGFAGLFRLDFDTALFARRYREPVLIACTDGVGTKLKVAQLTGEPFEFAARRGGGPGMGGARQRGGSPLRLA